jgi:hypothetical protein
MGSGNSCLEGEKNASYFTKVVVFLPNCTVTSLTEYIKKLALLWFLHSNPLKQKSPDPYD